jgi:hypothetical protein
MLLLLLLAIPSARRCRSQLSHLAPLISARGFSETGGRSDVSVARLAVANVVPRFVHDQLIGGPDTSGQLLCCSIWGVVTMRRNGSGSSSCRIFCSSRFWLLLPDNTGYRCLFCVAMLPVKRWKDCILF